jgi:hypothetical protein
MLRGYLSPGTLNATKNLDVSYRSTLSTAVWYRKFLYVFSLLAGIVGSNSAGRMHVCILWMLCVVRCRSLRRAVPSSRAVLPNVILCFKSEAAWVPVRMLY